MVFASKRPSSKKSKCNLRKSSRRNSIDYCNLEDRRMLAANIELVDAYLIDGNFNQITSPAVGEQVAVLSVWNTTDLPNSSSYRIGFYVDGVELVGGTTTAGSGLTQANGYTWYHFGWYATGAVQNVEVIADVYDNVNEADETDNTFNFSFSAQAPDIPQKLIWPMPDAPYSGVGVTNYTDVDPSNGIQDYNGGNAAYNGHNAFDAGPGSFQFMDAGYQLFAAADGVVTDIHDGEFDRQSATNNVPANYVIVDHGNGWDTIYWHMRRDSVQVEIGDSVTQGDFIGYMGSSGRSTGLHIHLGLRHHGRNVEPMYDQSAYFMNSFGYVGDNYYVYDSGTSNYTFGNHLKEGPSELALFSQDSGQRNATFARFSGIRAGDSVEFEWRRPDNSVYASPSATASQDYSNSWWWWWVNLPATPDLGTWRVDFNVNNVTIGQEFFEVTAIGQPEIRIEDTAAEIILDERFTPIDFGDVSQNAADPTQTFNVINHGTDTLTLGNIQLPTNYYVVNGLPASLAPGASDTLIVAMDTAVAGNHAGQIRIETNDADESTYNFSVEGYVANLDKLILGLSERQTTQGSSLLGKVYRYGSSVSSLVVALSTNDSDEVSLPGTVTIPAGEQFAMFPIGTPNDFVVDGVRVAEVFATAAGYDNATNELAVDSNLPDAIIRSNGMAGTQTVTFDLPTNAVINLRSELPIITDTVFIDATDHPNYAGTPLVTIDGTLAGTNVDGFRVWASDTEIKGLSIVNFSSDGISLDNADRTSLTDNYIGRTATDGDGGNGAHGIRLKQSKQVEIMDNLISNNGLQGIFASDNLSFQTNISGNMIGTNAAGTAAAGNGRSGIQVLSRLNTISDNLISGNGWVGIALTLNTSDSNTITSNKIGTDINGTAAVPNISAGIRIDSDDNVIGGATAADGNIIAANLQGGILLMNRADRTRIQNNLIGVTATNQPLGNKKVGINVVSSADVVIEDNTISDNDGPGVIIRSASSSNAQIINNRIGTTIDGQSPLGNKRRGLQIQNAVNGTVSGNVIADNLGGIVMTGSTATNYTFINNLIGLAQDGVTKLANASFQMFVRTAGNTIGQTGNGNTFVSDTATASLVFSNAVNNTVTSNFFGTNSTGSANLGGKFGIRITGAASTGNLMTNNVFDNIDNSVRLFTGAHGNTISSNTFNNALYAITNRDGGNNNQYSQNEMMAGVLVGIDNGIAGLQINDVDDIDEGPNRMQNSAGLVSASLSGGNLDLSYNIDTAIGNAVYPLTVEFFIASSNRVGGTYIGSDVFSASDKTAGTDKSITLSSVGILAGDRIVATVTDAAGNTSEFSFDKLVV